MRHITLDNSIEQPTLELLAKDAKRSLDVTQLDLRRLPANVKAQLYTEATIFNTSGLRTSGHIVAKNAENFIALQLKTSWNIITPRATTFIAPELRISGKIVVNDRVTIFEASPYLDLKMVSQELVAKRLATAHEIMQRLIATADNLERRQAETRLVAAPLKPA